MKKYEFMNELERNLIEVSYEERRDALRYYEDYFDEAGEENIDSVIKELGSPQKVAEKIKEDLHAGSAKKDNETVEHILASEKDLNEKRQKEKREKREKEEEKKNANSDYYNYQSYDNYGRTERNYKEKESIKGLFTAIKDYFRTLSTEKIIILVLLGIIVVPTIFSLLIGVVSVIFGIFVGLISLAFGLFSGTIGLFVGGTINIVRSISTLVISPASGMVVLGAGIIYIALAILLLAFAMSICRNVLPGFHSWIVNTTRKIINDVKEWLNNGNV